MFQFYRAKSQDKLTFPRGKHLLGGQYCALNSDDFSN